MPTARDVLVDRAARDVAESLDHLKERLHGQRGGLWRGIELGVLGLVGLLDPRGRIARDIDKLLDIARRHDEGEPPDRLAREHLHDILRLRELNLVVRVKDPAFARILGVAERILRERLPDFARMARVEDPVDYADLIRRAFPAREVVDVIVAHNVADVIQLIESVEQNPQILRVPSGWVPRLSALGREMIAWKLEQVRRELDEIYGRDSFATAP